MAVSIIERSIELSELDVYAVKNAHVSFEQAETYDDNASHLGMGFLLRYRQKIGEVSVSRFEFCEFQRWNYVKCRDDLKLVFRFISELQQKRAAVRFHGCSVKEAVFDRICSGRILPDQLETALNQSEWWDPRSVTGSTSGIYEKMKFTKFITAYNDFPMKSIQPVYNQYSSYPEAWQVALWKDGSGNQRYLSLSEALEDSFIRYHTPEAGASEEKGS